MNTKCEIFKPTPHTRRTRWRLIDAVHCRLGAAVGLVVDQCFYKFLKSSQADQAEYLRQLQAKRDRLQSHRYGDDRRQPTRHAPDKSTAQHPPGYDKALDAR